jgi:hypothetical protein
MKCTSENVKKVETIEFLFMLRMQVAINNYEKQKLIRKEDLEV